MNKRLIITVVLALAFFAGAFMLMGVFMDQKKAPQQSEKQQQKYFVKAEPVSYHAQKAIVRASGRVISQSNVNLVSEVQGRILGGEVNLKKGETFNEGDVLVRLYKEDMVYTLKSTKSSFLNLLATSLPDLKIDYPEEYTEWQAFFNTIDIEKDLPEMPQVKNEQLKVFLASRNLLSNYYSIKSQEEQLKKYTIHAPFDGTYISVNLEKGAVANPGSMIAQMIRTDELEVEVPVPASDAEFLKTNDKVQLTSESGTITLQGVISRKAAFIDQNTQSQGVFVKVSQADSRKIFQGQYLLAFFEGREMDNVMELPRNAVFNGVNAYIVEEGKLKQTTLDIHKYNEKTLFFSGITEGVYIVVEPLINAKEGTSVEIL